MELEERHDERGRNTGDRYVRVVRPHREEFRKSAPGRYRATEAVLEPQTPAGRFLDVVRRIVIGRRLATEEEITERVSKKTGLAVFASDNISSSAYATEETMRVLLLAGAGALALTLPLTLAVIVVLVVVVVSYLQTIRAYPNGGGSYIVASENLGTLPGLVAAAALLVDYVLTVSVSVAAGIAAIGAASALVYEHRVLTSLAVIAVLALGNLRGIRESGNIFAAPTYVYLASLGGILLFGLLRLAQGTLPALTPPPGWVPAVSEPLGAFLVLRAFASGAVALTGTEAIANGVPAFKPPESRNAGITLVLMGVSFGTLFLFISILATRMGIVADPTEQQTVLSQLASALVGEGPLFYLVQLSTAAILLLAANTSFADFPRLSSIMARDRFMPRQFSFRGDRLAFSTGIVVLALLSGALVVLFGGSVTNLIPLYTIGVFIAFTLSQGGMVRHWQRYRGRGWRPSLAMNAVGAVATAAVAVIVAVTKFEHGAWMVLAVIPVFVAVLYRVRRHYRDVEDELTVIDPEEADAEVVAPPRVVVPVGRLDRALLRALSFARSLSPDVVAVHVADDPAEGRRIERRWQRIVPEVPLVVIESPYRSLLPPLLRYLDRISFRERDRTTVVVLAEFVPRHWWEWVLHNQTALRLKLTLFFRPRTIVVDVPYRFDGA